MARKPQNNVAETSQTESKTPTHDLIVKFNHGGQEIILGRIGLFTGNNELHEFISQLPAEKIQTIHAKLSFELGIHGANKRAKQEFTADW